MVTQEKARKRDLFANYLASDWRSVLAVALFGFETSLSARIRNPFGLCSLLYHRCQRPKLGDYINCSGLHVEVNHGNWSISGKSNHLVGRHASYRHEEGALNISRV